MTNIVINLRNDKKVNDICIFDLSQNSNKLIDYCIMGSGTFSKHTQSVAEHMNKLLQSKGRITNTEGNAKDGWVTFAANVKSCAALFMRHRK